MRTSKTADSELVLELDSVAKCNEYIGIDSPYEHVSVVDLSQIAVIRHRPKRHGVYIVSCSWSKQSDVTTIRFRAPGQLGSFSSGEVTNPQGWLIIFDTALLESTLLERRMNEYPFFKHNSDITLELSGDERDMVVNCMRSIGMELRNPEDRFTTRILAAGLAVMLSLCMRYYERKHATPRDAGDSIIRRLNTILSEYASGDRRTLSDMPSVTSLAEALHISSNYLGDVVRKKLHCSAQHYIRRIIVQEAKRQLSYTNLTIGEISYNLGFKYPHHLTRVFKREEGTTPHQYREQLAVNNK